MSHFSKVNIAGDTNIKAFTICVWLKTSDQNYIGLLRYSDDGINDRISLSIQPSDGRLVFTLFGQDR